MQMGPKELSDLAQLNAELEREIRMELTKALSSNEVERGMHKSMEIGEMARLKFELPPLPEEVRKMLNEVITGAIAGVTGSAVMQNWRRECHAVILHEVPIGFKMVSTETAPRFTMVASLTIEKNDHRQTSAFHSGDEPDLTDDERPVAQSTRTRT